MGYFGQMNNIANWDSKTKNVPKLKQILLNQIKIFDVMYLYIGTCGALFRFSKLLLLLIPIKIYQLSTVPDSDFKINIYILAWLSAMVVAGITKVIRLHLEKKIFDIDRIRNKALDIIQKKNFASNLIKRSISNSTQIISATLIASILFTLNDISLFIYLLPIVIVYIICLNYVKSDYADILSAIFFMICIVVFIYFKHDVTIDLNVSIISCFLIRFILNDMSKLVHGIYNFNKDAQGLK